MTFWCRQQAAAVASLFALASPCALAGTPGADGGLGSQMLDGHHYRLVRNIGELAKGIAANPAGYFALAEDYDASADGTYASAPIPTVFTGVFDGRGHTISNLSINDPTDNNYVGLFAEMDSGGTIRNLTLANESVVGGSGSSLQDSTEFIGGLVGYDNGGTILRVSAAGSLSGGGYVAAGGLVGIGGGLVQDCDANLSVSIGSVGEAGGLVGGTSARMTIKNASAEGSVTGDLFIGGLIGFNYTAASIERSHATGTVTGTGQYTTAGGLVGYNASATIARSFATGSVTCRSNCGGLVGWNTSNGGESARIFQSYATGGVTGGGVGGLVGYNTASTIANSYAAGAVSGQEAGGLVGQNDNDVPLSILHSYSTGAVSGASGSTGGLIGYDYLASTTKRAYWDTTTSGITNLGQGAGNVSNDPGITGLSNTQLQSRLPKGFNPRIWGENADINGGLPYLLALPPSESAVH